MKELVVLFSFFLFFTNVRSQQALPVMCSYEAIDLGRFRTHAECHDAFRDDWEKKRTSYETSIYDYPKITLEIKKISDDLYVLERYWNGALWGRGKSEGLEVPENKCTAIAGKFTKLSVPTGWVHVDSTGEMRDFKPSGSAPDKVCKGGCQYLLMSNEVVPGSTVYAPKINNGGYHPVFSQFTYAGSDTQCQAETDLSTPSTPPPEKPKEPEEPKKPEEPFTCPTGQCPGVANGQQICVPCNSGPGKGSGDGDKDGKDKEGSDKKADSKADPASSAASSAGNGNGNGSNGQSNGNGTGNGQGSGGGSDSGSGSKSDSTGKRPGESEGGDDGPPPQYGERPELYEPKYKDGVKGVWDEKKGQLKDTKLANLAKKLMPKENKGDCPKWQIDMNWGKGMNFGLLNLAPPCAIWPVLRAIVMVCSLLLARRLVFGG